MVSVSFCFTSCCADFWLGFISALKPCGGLGAKAWVRLHVACHRALVALSRLLLLATQSQRRLHHPPDRFSAPGCYLCYPCFSKRTSRTGSVMFLPSDPSLRSGSTDFSISRISPPRARCCHRGRREPVVLAHLMALNFG